MGVVNWQKNSIASDTLLIVMRKGSVHVHLTRDRHDAAFILLLSSGTPE